MSGNDIGSIYRAQTARPAHLALVASNEPARGAERTGRAHAATSYDKTAAGPAAGRVATENSVRAVARSHDSFEAALLPMVMASGVSREAATHVAATILEVPALRRQAEDAFRAARIASVPH